MSADVVLSHRAGTFVLDAAFQWEAPGVTALFGPSGAGKSTIVSAIAGLVTPRAGRVAIDGTVLLDTQQGISVAPRRRRLGVVFQDARLFPHLTVRDNLLYGWRRSRERCDDATTTGVIALLGLEGLLSRRPRTLSGGERSRVALGRALLSNPRALLLDEPLAALDTPRRLEILPYLERLRDTAKVPILYVSHALDEVTRLADRMIVLREGRVVAQGQIAEVTARLDVTGGNHVIPGSVLDAVVVGHDTEHALTMLNVAGTPLVVPVIAGVPGHKVRIRIDAEDILLALSRPEDISANNVLATRVSDIRAGGSTPFADVQLALGEAHLVARITRRSLERLQLAHGMAVYAIIKSVTMGGRDR